MIIQENSYWANIYVGQRVEYTSEIIPIDIAKRYLHDYCNKIGLCVTITETTFIYKNEDRATSRVIDGEEPGFIVGLINYPLYPAQIQVIHDAAEEIATYLKSIYKQLKVTIVYPDITKTIK